MALQEGNFKQLLMEAHPVVTWIMAEDLLGRLIAEQLPMVTRHHYVGPTTRLPQEMYARASAWKY
jgi:hypothetical protein